MHEVETQAIRRHQRATLGDVIAEHLAQRLMQQMRRRVVRPDRARREWSTSNCKAVPTFSVPCSTVP